MSGPALPHGMAKGKLATNPDAPANIPRSDPVEGTSSLNLAASGAKSGGNFRIGSRQEPTRKRTRMVTYLDAATAPVSNTGQIRLYAEEGLPSMHKACDLTARGPDELLSLATPGAPTAP